MKSAGKYLAVSEHDTFYFRRSVPKDIRPYLGKRELKTSLGTKNRHVAERKVLLLYLNSETLFDYVRQKSMWNNYGSMGFIVRKTSPKGDCIEIEIDSANVEQETEALKKFGIHESIIKLFDSTANINTIENFQTPLLLSELITRYCEDCIAENKWTRNTTKTNRETLNTLLFIVGDINISSLDRTLARDVRDKLKQYPKNKNKDPRYKDCSVEDLSNLQIENTISARTINKHLTTYSGMLNWATKESITSSNPFTGMQVKDNVAAHDKRHSFDHDDLEKIFNSEVYTNNGYDRPYQYWIPLIGLYTGARLEEIAQLELADIKQTNNMYVFDINGSPSNDGNSKSTKNSSSIRQVPIHSKLIQLGLLNYISKLTNAGETRLFPELKLDSKGRYSRNVGDWFNGVHLKSVGIEDKKKVFHSFRSTLANELEDIGASHQTIQSITGHSSGRSVLQTHYLGQNKAHLLKDWIEKVRFCHALTRVKRFK